MRKQLGPRRSTSAWKPPTGTGSAPTGRKIEGSQIHSSRRQYKPVEKRLATAVWALITKTQLWSAGSRN